MTFKSKSPTGLLWRIHDPILCPLAVVHELLSIHVIRVKAHYTGLMIREKVLKLPNNICQFFFWVQKAECMKKS